MTTTFRLTPVTRQRLTTSVPLRLSTAALSDTIAHLHADLTGTDRASVAAHLRQGFPAFQALLAYRLASSPAACVHTLDHTLLTLTLHDKPAALHDWVGDLAHTLAA